MSLNYRPEIDGLRAFAILPVLAFHFGATWMPGGYLGVDVFFVISGYLIGSILLREMGDGTFRFRAFWIRRIRRITPALLTMTLATLLLSGFVIFPPYQPTVGSDALASTFSGTNITMLLKSAGYWEPEATASPFLHTWSLSVEEQFYLLFPAFLFLLTKYRFNVVTALAWLAVLSLIMFVGLTFFRPRLAFYLLPARGWELAAGGLIAALPVHFWNSISRPWRNLLVTLGFVAIIGSYFFVPGGDSFSLATIVPVLGACCIVFAARQEGIGRWVLSNPLTVGIGKVSFSLYLWHWSVLVLSQAAGARFQASLPWWLTLGIAVTLAVASYFLVEKPLRTRKRFWGPFFLLLIPVIVLGTFIWQVPPRVLDTSAFLRKTTSSQYDLAPTAVKPTAYREDGDLVGLRQQRPQIVVIGDSHAAIWGSTMNVVGKSLETTIALFALTSDHPFFSIPLGNPPESSPKWTSTQKQDYAKNLLQKLDTWRPAVVILACRWDNFGERGLKGAIQLVQYCEERKIKIIVIEQAPRFAFGNFDATEYLAYLGVVPQEGKKVYLERSAREKVEAANARAVRLLASGPGASVLRVGDKLVQGNQALILSGEKVLYRDEDHLSDWGTELFEADLVEVLGPLLAAHAPRP